MELYRFSTQYYYGNSCVHHSPRTGTNVMRKSRCRAIGWPFASVTQQGKFLNIGRRPQGQCIRVYLNHPSSIFWKVLNWITVTRREPNAIHGITTNNRIDVGSAFQRGEGESYKEAPVLANQTISCPGSSEVSSLIARLWNFWSAGRGGFEDDDVKWCEGVMGYIPSVNHASCFHPIGDRIESVSNTPKQLKQLSYCIE